MAPETFQSINRRRGIGGVISPKSKAEAMIRVIEESSRAADSMKGIDTHMHKGLLMDYIEDRFVSSPLRVALLWCLSQQILWKNG